MVREGKNTKKISGMFRNLFDGWYSTPLASLSLCVCVLLVLRYYKDMSLLNKNHTITNVQVRNAKGRTGFPNAATRGWRFLMIATTIGWPSIE